MKRALLVASLWMAACGGSGLQPFTGSWKYAPGASLSYHCTSTPPEFLDLQGEVVALFEDGGALVATRNPDQHPPCTQTLEVKDGVATAQAGAPCPYDAGFLPTPIQISLPGETLTLSPDQKSLFETGVGTATVIGVSCPAAISGTLVKQ